MKRADPHDPLHPSETSKTAKRKRGAQAGNKNALKHGFYSRSFRSIELSDLDLIADSSAQILASEITALRVFTRRVFEAVNRADPDCEDVDWIAHLNALGLAYIRIGTLLKTQKMLEGDQASAVSATITQALQEITKELKLYV